MKVEIWSDIACPWCFIGKRRFELALAAFEHRDEVEVQWRSYQLDPSIPAGDNGTERDYLVERKGMPATKVDQMLEQMTALAATVDLHYDFAHVLPANSFDAHRLLHLAAEHGLQDAAKERLLSGHFELGEDIADVGTLASIGVELGLDDSLVRTVLASTQFADDVRSDIAEAGALGINGVPFFVIDRKYGISGAQPVEVFTQTLDQAWTESQPLMMSNAASADAEGAVCGPDGCAVS